MITLDGSQCEGGGQIVPSLLALSLVTARRSGWSGYAPGASPLQAREPH
jgi:hypothetical protein